MTRMTSRAAHRRSRRRPASRHHQVWARPVLALALASLLLLPPPTLASRQAGGRGASVLSSVPWALTSLLDVMAKAVSGSRRGRAALPGAGSGVAASVPPQSPPAADERQARVTQLAVPSLPLDPTP